MREASSHWIFLFNEMNRVSNNNSLCACLWQGGQINSQTNMIMKYLILVAVLTLIAFLQPFQFRAMAQNSPIDTALASQYFAESQALCNRDNGRLWGVSLCAPILLVDPQTRRLVANQPDKEGFLLKDKNVFVGKLPAQMNIANTATEWAGVKWTMIIFPLPEDQHRRLGLMAHEMWHRVQNELGFPGSSAANNHLDTRDGRVWLQLEWRALARALASDGKRERRQAIADAVLFRSYRRVLFPQAASEEREMEMHEGLAEYTGVKLSESPNLNQFVIKNNLQEAPLQQSFVRSFAYATGPAYGVLLDETNTNWRQKLKKENDLGTLLAKRFGINLHSEIKQAAEVRAKNYDGNKLQTAEIERENNRRKLMSEYRAQLVDGAVLEIPLQKMNMQFNPNNLLPLDPLGTIYPNIRIADVWGILTVSKGALMNPDFSTIYVSTPSNLSSSPIQGDGWILELNAGWVVAAGERKGSYILKKSEP